MVDILVKMSECSGVAHKRQENPKRQIRHSHLFFFYFSIKFLVITWVRKYFHFPLKMFQAVSIVISNVSIQVFFFIHKPDVCFEFSV